MFNIGQKWAKGRTNKLNLTNKYILQDCIFIVVIKTQSILSEISSAWLRNVQIVTNKTVIEAYTVQKFGVISKYLKYLTCIMFTVL